MSVAHSFAERPAFPRLAGLAGWTTIMAAVFAAVSLTLLAVPSARRAARRQLARWWARGICWVLGVQVVATTVPPRRPFLLASNHLGYLDIVVLLAQTGTVFVAKREVAQWPVWGVLARLAGTIFVDRTRPRDAVGAAERIERALAAGEGVILFPEGTSSSGRTVLPLKPALLDVAVRHKIPVHYATLGYRTPPGAPDAADVVCWWGDMPFGPHVMRMARIPSIEARVAWGGAPVLTNDRKSLARALHAKLLETACSLT